VAASLDPRIRRYLLPTRIVWQTDGAAAPQAPEVLLQNDTGQSTVSPPSWCLLTHSGTPPGILLDFGRELNGGVQIVVSDVKGYSPPRCRVRFGESATEAMSEPNNDHALHDHLCRIPRARCPRPPAR